MRLVQILLFLTCIAALSTISVSMICSNEKLRLETKVLKESYERDKFIHDGFKAMCKKINEVDSENEDGWYTKSIEWKNLCLSMFALEEMRLEITNDGYRQIWKVNDRRMVATFKK